MKRKPTDPWLLNMVHQNKGMRGIRVYYMMSTTEVICSDIAVRTSGSRVIFPDGNWNSVKDCFLSKAQCRQAHGVWFKEALIKAKQVLEKAAEGLEEADARIQGALVSLDEQDQTT